MTNSTLLNPHDVNSSVSVVPIIGIGGLGKTTLAQQVYNDEDVKNHFEGLMKWVCVSDESSEFSIKRIAQNITGKEYGTMEQVAQGLRKGIERKRFLLVLDDVWNDNREKWLELENMLRGGEKGSMIIVTTRSEKVAQIMGTIDEPFRLDDLDFISSWELFCRVAFRDGKEPENQELVGIGKDIVRRCSGVPLAIRTIGSLLFTKRLGVSEWSCFRDNELANMDSDEENKTFSILKLSYDHLPSHLKNCFSFCSLFPKDHLIERKTLIQLWIAEGFIQPLNKNMRLEDVGDEYFEQLLSRCLFQDARRNRLGDIECYKMHDLIHDLALLITKNDCYIVTSDERIEEKKLGDGIRHVSSHFNRAWKFPFGDIKAKKVRTIFSPEISCKFHPTTSLPEHLRVLHLRNQVLPIPKTIQDLKQLRHLDLTGSLELRKLPPEIMRLHNLPTLILNQCLNLIELPKDMRRLVRLRHLELDVCRRLMFMPCGLGCLSNLQTLTRFVVDKRRSGSARITEVRDLSWLRGGLKIQGLETQRGNIKEVESSKFLLHMPYLSELKLVWPLPLEPLSFREGAEQKDEIILEALELPHTIKELHIKGFDGQCLSKWIGSLTLLQTLYLKDCKTLASLPKSIGSLTSLKILRLVHCNSLASLPESIGILTSLQKLCLMNCSALTSLPESFGSLTSLQKLSLMHCRALASLPESFGSLTSLQLLSLKYCCALTSLPESFGSLAYLQKLSLEDCPALALLPESFGSLTSLQTLHLFFCRDLTSLPVSFGSITSLQTLRLDYCYALESFPESIGSLTSLQTLHLYACPALASFPTSIKNLTSLQTLSLKSCSSLTSVPESIGSLTSLQTLRLENSTLASLPESIGSLTSLQTLDLYDCPVLAFLPTSIKNLTSLQCVHILYCYALRDRYGRQLEGADWPGLAHVPDVQIYLGE